MFEQKATKVDERRTWNVKRAFVEEGRVLTTESAEREVCMTALHALHGGISKLNVCLFEKSVIYANSFAFTPQTLNHA
jgi:hypothetical protein